MNLKVISGVSLVSSIERCGGFDGAAVYKITADWENSDVKEGGSLKILVEYPICGITNVWLPNSAPMLGVPRFVKPDWNGRHPFCNIARSAPLLSFYDNADENRFNPCTVGNAEKCGYKLRRKRKVNAPVYQPLKLNSANMHRAKRRRCISMQTRRAYLWIAQSAKRSSGGRERAAVSR